MGRSFYTTPQEVKELGQSIAQYTLPPGYTETFGLRLFGAEVVMISQNNETDLTAGMFIILMQVPPNQGVDNQALQQQLELSLGSQAWFQAIDLNLAYTKTLTLNDQSVVLKIQDGMDSSGNPYQQASALVPTQNNTVFFIAQGPQTAWEQEALETFLLSIK